VAKLADAPDLGSGGAILRGSSPLLGMYFVFNHLQYKLISRLNLFSGISRARKAAQKWLRSVAAIIALQATADHKPFAIRSLRLEPTMGVQPMTCRLRSEELGFSQDIAASRVTTSLYTFARCYCSYIAVKRADGLRKMLRPDVT
jgi:hypothetical protein